MASDILTVKKQPVITIVSLLTKPVNNFQIFKQMKHLLITIHLDKRNFLLINMI